ncbi:hypothetical protein NAL19_2306 [Pectobacterium sp. F1-1]|nr:hypothetical protein NAL19_2306 [Pectobacterium sp. F1-1]
MKYVTLTGLPLSVNGCYSLMVFIVFCQKVTTSDEVYRALSLFLLPCIK